MTVSPPRERATLIADGGGGTASELALLPVSGVVAAEAVAGPAASAPAPQTILALRLIQEQERAIGGAALPEQVGAAVSQQLDRRTQDATLRRVQIESGLTGCLGTDAGVPGPQSRRTQQVGQRSVDRGEVRRWDGGAEVMIPALLAAFVTTQTLLAGRQVVLDARVVGVVAALVVALWLRSPVLVVLVAAGATATARALSS